MSAAHVRRGGAARTKPRKSAKVSVPRKIAKRLPVDQTTGEQARGSVFRRLPARDRGGGGHCARYSGKGRARRWHRRSGGPGFTVNGYQIVGLQPHEPRARRRSRDRRASSRCRFRRWRQGAPGSGRRRRPSVSGCCNSAGSKMRACRAACRTRSSSILSNARRRRCGRTKVKLALIDSEGVVLARVPVDKMPDLPLVIGPGANSEEQQLERLMAAVPTLKPQLASATWVGGRRWDLNLPVGRDSGAAGGRGNRPRGADEIRPAR